MFFAFLGLIDIIYNQINRELTAPIFITNFNY